MGARRCRRRAALPLLLPLLCLAPALAAAPLPLPLVPFDYITGQLVDLDTGAAAWALGGLSPSTSYEVRVSWPASIPAAISFELVDGADTARSAAGAPARRRAGRRLLDTEKLVFATDAAAGVQARARARRALCAEHARGPCRRGGGAAACPPRPPARRGAAAQGFAQPLVIVRAARRSVHRDGPKGGPSQLVYNIVLAEVVLGLPTDIVPVVAAVVVVSLGAAALAARRRLVKGLLSNRRLPPQGWDEATIELLLQDAALMDSNTFPGQVGMGEREGRIACPLVARRAGRLAHGVGRSGDIAAEQPKAAGSSLLAKLSAALAGDALRLAGLVELAPPLVLPCATGMTLTLALLAAAGAPPDVRAAGSDAPAGGAAGSGAAGAPAGEVPGPRFVVWSRVDQKTCLKAITAANLVPVVVELRRQGDELVTDVAALRSAVEARGPAAVAAVVTTTSCFAPRCGGDGAAPRPRRQPAARARARTRPRRRCRLFAAPPRSAADDVVGVAALCAELGVPHVVNNAYGVGAAALGAALTAAARRGRVDAVVQSTDKNFMVPVGGALLAAPRGRGRDWLPRAVAAAYPGRASAGAAVDLLVTLLHWGAPGWAAALSAREALHPYLRRRLSDAAAALGERLLETPGNPISLGLTLDGLARAADGANAAAAAARGGAGADGKARQRADVAFLGAMLWARNVSGTRVLTRGKAVTVGGVAFADYGTHTAGYPHAYLTAAAALGGSEAEVDAFVARLARCYAELRAKWAGPGRGLAAGGAGADGGAEGREGEPGPETA
ncbi:hypothetical protein HT031_003050 [Scenedesmus sp. PABB004]|nr:hypothetical protein HT031_003050 [Scenedesmus sp. PABB004]